eukprot:jgi/Mesvir1/14984/Mv14646-RA.1
MDTYTWEDTWTVMARASGYVGGQACGWHVTCTLGKRSRILLGRDPGCGSRVCWPIEMQLGLGAQWQYCQRAQIDRLPNKRRSKRLVVRTWGPGDARIAGIILSGCGPRPTRLAQNNVNVLNSVQFSWFPQCTVGDRGRTTRVTETSSWHAPYTYAPGRFSVHVGIVYIDQFTDTKKSCITDMDAKMVNRCAYGSICLKKQHALTGSAGQLRRPKSPQYPSLTPARTTKTMVKLEQGDSGGTGTVSLIPETLAGMQEDPLFLQVQEDLRTKGQKKLTSEERARRRRALDGLGVPSFDGHLASNGTGTLHRTAASILQINIGLYCNQACSHCHVESSPLRSEMMDRSTVDQCLKLLDCTPSIHTVDITGGAPELNTNFRYLVTEARKRGKEVIDRCNLTVLEEPGQQDLAKFLADHQVRVVASLPCYTEGTVDKQRGRGVFERSIEGLKTLNELGYGHEGSGLELDLVYNPSGAFLPPAQEMLEVAYKDELSKCHGIVFNRLFCLANMPIKRFADYLSREGKMEQYMQLLVNNFNPAATKGLMCKDTVSIRWDGSVFDCDFNQQLDIGVTGKKRTVFDFESLDELTGWKVATDNHCFGCTAGAGSSCQGTTA